MRTIYRARQFWLALVVKPASTDLEQARKVLTAELLSLFSRLQPSEQAHALQVLNKLRTQGDNHPDLLTAALLHDAGKQRLPLQPWQRALVVLGKWLWPRQARRWGEITDPQPGSLSAWQLPFVVAEQHPRWGAEMARQAGASPLVQAIIRRHQDPVNADSGALEDELIHKLQVVDNNS